MGFHGIPQGRLAKFRGDRSRADELSLREWLEEFEQVLSPYETTMTPTERAQALVDHLAGAARDEVMCLSTEKRKDYAKIKGTLELCFKSDENVQSLSMEFHNRKQGERESLADFSRALMRLYGKMEATAPTGEEGEALKKLRDRSLRDQFTGGAREAWVRRELRRIALATKGKEFEEMREEALYLFQDAGASSQSARVREVTFDNSTEQPMKDRRTGTDIAESIMSKMLDGQNQLLAQMTSMREEINDLKRLASDVGEMRTALNQLQQRRKSPRPAHPDLVCYNCNQKGHYANECPTYRSGRFQQQGAARNPQHSQQGN